MKKCDIHQHVLDRIQGDNLKVLEYGRIRNAEPRVNEAGGWSTLHIPEHERVEVLYSLDTNPYTLETTKQVVPKGLLKKIVFAETIDELDLEENSLDMVFLDADNDPLQQMELWYECREFIKENGWVLVDDVFDRKGHKGDVLIPYFWGLGCAVIELDPMAAIQMAKKVRDYSV